MSGSVGFVGDYNIVNHVIRSMIAINYTGSLGFGLAVVKDGKFECITKNGVVVNNIGQMEMDRIGQSKSGIGHVACGKSGLQPEIITVGKSEVVCCANTAFETFTKIKDLLQSQKDVVKAVKEVLSEIKEPFALTVLRLDGSLVVARSDGRMPVAIGRIDNDGMNGYYVSSQRGILGGEAEFLHSLFVGEMAIIRADGLHRIAVNPCPNVTRCLQETIFWQRPDNVCADRGIHATRLSIGKALGRKFLKTVQLSSGLSNVIAIAIPDGGRSYLEGFGKKTKIDTDSGAINKSRYPLPSTIKTIKGLEAPEYSMIEEIVRGKVVIIVDDAAKTFSRIRAMTKKAYEYGAKEVHAVLATVITKDCPHGKDIAMGEYVFDLKSSGLTSLTTLTTSEMKAAINTPHRIYCFDCQL